MTHDKLRQIPSVDSVLAHPMIIAASHNIARPILLRAIRHVLDELRQAIHQNESIAIEIDTVVAEAIASAEQEMQSSLRKAINATGIILHTGLGRAVLADAACEAISSIAYGHSTLEVDVESGRRGSRIGHVEDILKNLTGAEAATVVNNNAAAVLLAVNTFAEGKDVIISRGQLVEIGGQFRVPDVIKSAGCRLVEVGTTNRTRISDYEAAITPDTGLILRVHPSNFKIVGFTEEPTIAELAKLGKEAGIPVMDDLGSGALIDLSLLGIKDEPTAQDSVRANCDVISFSGDKLLGATQAGILIGKTEFIEKCRKNPLARALRVDKLTLAGLEATIRLYYDQENAIKAIPTLRYISRSLSQIEKLADELSEKLRSILGILVDIRIENVMSQVGGGSLPGQNLESKAVTLRSDHFSAEDSINWFRKHKVPIFGRIENDRLIFDVRTLESEEIDIIVDRARGLVDME